MKESRFITCFLETNTKKRNTEFGNFITKFFGSGKTILSSICSVLNDEGECVVLNKILDDECLRNQIVRELNLDLMNCVSTFIVGTSYTFLRSHVYKNNLRNIIFVALDLFCVINNAKCNVCRYLVGELFDYACKFSNDDTLLKLCDHVCNYGSCKLMVSYFSVAYKHAKCNFLNSKLRENFVILDNSKTLDFEKNARLFKGQLLVNQDQVRDFCVNLLLKNNKLVDSCETLGLTLNLLKSTKKHTCLNAILFTLVCKAVITGNLKIVKYIFCNYDTNSIKQKVHTEMLHVPIITNDFDMIIYLKKKFNIGIVSNKNVTNKLVLAGNIFACEKLISNNIIEISKEELFIIAKKAIQLKKNQHNTVAWLLQNNIVDCLRNNFFTKFTLTDFAIVDKNYGLTAGIYDILTKYHKCFHEQKSENMLLVTDFSKKYNNILKERMRALQNKNYKDILIYFNIF